MLLKNNINLPPPFMKSFHPNGWGLKVALDKETALAEGIFPIPGDAQGWAGWGLGQLTWWDMSLPMVVRVGTGWAFQNKTC